MAKEDLVFSMKEKGSLVVIYFFGNNRSRLKIYNVVEDRGYGGSEKGYLCFSTTLMKFAIYTKTQSTVF